MNMFFWIKINLLLFDFIGRFGEKTKMFFAWFEFEPDNNVGWPDVDESEAKLLDDKEFLLVKFACKFEDRFVKFGFVWFLFILTLFTCTSDSDFLCCFTRILLLFIFGAETLGLLIKGGCWVSFKMAVLFKSTDDEDEELDEFDWDIDVDVGDRIFVVMFEASFSFVEISLYLGIDWSWCVSEHEDWFGIKLFWFCSKLKSF